MEQFFLELFDSNTYQSDNYIFFLLVIVPVIIWVAVSLWVWRDISSRTKNIIAIIFCFLLVLCLPLLGLIIYLLVRPHSTLQEESSMQLFHASVLDHDITSCPECKNLVRKEYKFCPHCSASLKKKCPNCNAEVNPVWNHCVACGYYLLPPTRWERYKRSKTAKRLNAAFKNMRKLGYAIFNLPTRITKIVKAGWRAYVAWVSRRLSGISDWRKQSKKDSEAKKTQKNSSKKTRKSKSKKKKH